MREVWGADKLEAELEAARDGLRGLDRNIRKIFGRDIPEGENGPIQSSPRFVTLANKRPLQEDRRRQVFDFSKDEHGGKRRWQGGKGEPKTVFSRLSAKVPSNADDSGDEDDGVFRPAVHSRVIATPREIPSRQEVLRRERMDERSRQRNKRMFGALLGTLQKFRQEETKLKAKEDKKTQVEARVEEAKRREKEELRRERQQLFLSRKQKLAQVKALEIKLARTRQFEDWRNAHLPLTHFIKTKTQPHIYYLPKRLNAKTEALLQESSQEMKEEIERREQTLNEELESLQVGFGKYQSVSSAGQEERSVEEGEENRDPNPDNGENASNEVDVSGSNNESHNTTDEPMDMTNTRDNDENHG